MAGKSDNLLSALIAALPELEAAKKNKANPAFRGTKYADLGAVIEAIRPIAEHGLWFRQVSHDADGGAMVETFYIGHGEELSAGKVFVPADKSNAQGYGSAQTYARRYGLVTAFGLSTEDDDGIAAAANPPRREAGGQTQGEAVSPRASNDYPFPEGPAENITALKAMARALWREVEGTGDNDELSALLDTKDAKATIAQLAALENPAHRQIWEGDGRDNPGLAGLINRKKTEFAQQIADYATV